VNPLKRIITTEMQKIQDRDTPAAAPAFAGIG
jgi:hypothetical protein